MKSLWASVRVIGTFLGLIMAFFFVLTWSPIVERIDIGAWLARTAAWMSWGILRALGPVMGYDVRLSGTLMGAGDFEVDVTEACSAAVPTTIYLSAVLAYPAGWWAKLTGSVLGVAIIYLTNLVRVVALFLIGLYFNEIFHEIHVYVAQALVVCVAVALWLFWAARVADAPPH